MLVRFCSLNSSRRCPAVFAKAMNNCASCWHSVANAHAVLASSCALNSSRHCSAVLANAMNNCASCWPPVAILANAHAVFVSSCALNSSRRRSTVLVNMLNNCASCWLPVANAHVILASSCALNSLLRCCAIFAKHVKSSPTHSFLQLLATPYATLASYRAPIFPATAARFVCCTRGSIICAFFCSQSRSTGLCFTNRLSNVQQAER